MKSFLMGFGVGIGLGVLFAPAPGDDTRRELGERLNSVTEEAQRQAQDLFQRVRHGLDKESRLDSDDLICEQSPKKELAREIARPDTRSTERTGVVNS